MFLEAERRMDPCLFLCLRMLAATPEAETDGARRAAIDMKAIVSFIVDVVVVLKNIGDGSSVLCVVASSCSKLSLDFTIPVFFHLAGAGRSASSTLGGLLPDCARNCALFRNRLAPFNHAFSKVCRDYCPNPKQIIKKP